MRGEAWWQEDSEIIKTSVRPVKVTVEGADGDGETITLSTLGQTADTADGWCLRYEETSPESMESVQTVMYCREGGVTVVRVGSVVSTIVYREKETFVSDYETAMGKFVLRVFPTEVEAMRQPDGGGVIRLAYQINLSSEIMPSGEMAMRWLRVRFLPWKG